MLKDIEQVKRIQELIQKAQVKVTKAEAVMEERQKEWKEKYGFTTLEAAKDKQKEFQAKCQSIEEKRDEVFKELLAVTDWDKLEAQLK